MRTDSGKAISFINNIDVREEFAKIFKDENSLSFWRNHIRRRLKTSIISKYERNTTEDDILGQLKMQIYVPGTKCKKVEYRSIKHFMYSKIQNIIRNKEKHLTVTYEKYLQKEESGEVVYDAKPTTYPETEERFVELNTERIGKPLLTGEDKYAYQNNFPRKWLDREKFRADARTLLSEVEFTDLLAIFNGLMEGKSRFEIMEEYGFTEREYHNSYRRVLYKLRRGLSVEYMQMYSTEYN
jgi:hypothetical protein